MSAIEMFKDHPPMTWKTIRRMLTPGMLRESVEAMAQWTLRAVELGQAAGGCAYRDAYVNPDGTTNWSSPYSNTAERISTWLWLAEYLEDERYVDVAADYARWMIEHEYGMYKGEEESVRGMTFYWTQDGQYVTIYTMRIPEPFFRLTDITGDGIFAQWGETVGKTLAGMQTEAGLLPEAWTVKNGWPEAGKDRDNPAAKVNGRVGYALGTFAELYRRTGDERYRRAYERLLEAMTHVQNEDGSVAHDLQIFTRKVLDPCRKNHFMGYLLLGMTRAYEVFPSDELLGYGRKLAEFVVRQMAHQWVLPYIFVDDNFTYKGSNEGYGKNTPITDPIAGLVRLYKITGDEMYLDTALKMFLTAYMHQYRGEHPDAYGAICNTSNTFGLHKRWSLKGEHEEAKERYGIYIGGHFCFEYLRGAELLAGLPELWEGEGRS